MLRVVDHKPKGIRNLDKMFLKVVWSGFPIKEATWEPLSSFDDKSIVYDYFANKIEKLISIKIRLRERLEELASLEIARQQ